MRSARAQSLAHPRHCEGADGAARGLSGGISSVSSAGAGRRFELAGLAALARRASADREVMLFPTSVIEGRQKRDGRPVSRRSR